MIGDILAKLLKVLLGWFTEQNEKPTVSTDAPDTPDERDALRERVREWEARRPGGPGQDHSAGGAGHAGKGLCEGSGREVGTLSQPGEH